MSFRPGRGDGRRGGGQLGAGPGRDEAASASGPRSDGSARAPHGALRADDLRFTPQEADEFLNGRLALGLMPEEIDVLVDRMEGWPAGLYLMALSLGRTADRRALVHELGTSSRHVIDFLETEVLNAQDPPMQALMLRSSILDRLSGPLCDAVLEQQDSEPMLDVLSRSNLSATSPTPTPSACSSAWSWDPETARRCSAIGACFWRTWLGAR